MNMLTVQARVHEFELVQYNACSYLKLAIHKAHTYMHAGSQTCKHAGGRKGGEIS